MSIGIEARHGRSCTSRRGGRCSCTPTWQANVWDARSTRRIRKTFKSKAAARQWRQDAIVALRRGEMSAERGPTLAEATAKWLAAMEAGHERNRSGDPYKPSAIRGYRDTLRLRVLPALGHVRVRELTTRDVQRWVDGLCERQPPLAPATIDVAVTALKAYYRRAVVRGEVPTNPTVGILKPAVRCKPKRVASPHEAAAMLDALDAADRGLWATAFYGGLRRGELVALRWEDVDLASGVIRVRRGWDRVEGEVAPKSHRGKRAVPIPAPLRDHLVEHRMQAVEGPRVFGSDGSIRGQMVRARARWAERGLPDLTLHEGRHTYASLMIAAEVNAKALSTFMGHASIAITYDLYGHLFPGSEAEAADLLDAYLAREAGGATVAPTVAHEAIVR